MNQFKFAINDPLKLLKKYKEPLSKEITKDVIFLSSTYLDIEEIRKQILLTFQSLEIPVQAMELFGLSASIPLKKSLSKLEGADIYLGILSEKYGTVDDDSGKSITQLEYEYALKLFDEGKIKDIWILKPSQKFKPSNDEIEPDEEKKEKLRKFKEIVCQNHTVGFYNNFDHLQTQIITQYFRSYLNQTSTIVTNAGIGDQSLRESGKPTDQSIQFVHEKKTLELTTKEQEDLKKQIYQINKILGGISKDKIEIENIDVKSITKLGNYYYNIEDFENSEKMFNLILKSFPDDIRALNNKACTIRAKNRLNEAFGLYKKALEIEPDYSDAKINLAAMLIDMGKIEEALQILLEVKEKEKNEPILMLNIGLCYKKLGDYRKAHEYYSIAEEKEPADPRILIHIATLFQREDKFQKALEYAERVLNLNSEDENALVTKGSSLLELNQWSQGIRYLEKAEKINPKDTVLLINLALAYRRIHEYSSQKIWSLDMVEMYSEKALEINKEESAALGYLGWVYAQCKSYEKAIKYFEKSLQHNPYSLGIIVDYIMTLSESGRYEESLKKIDEVLKIFEADWEIMLIKYQILVHVEKYEEATKIMQKIEKIKPMWRFFSTDFFRQINWFGENTRPKRGLNIKK